MRTIGHYMTHQPWSVQADDSIAVARLMLAQRQIRHLPVLDGGKLIGMVTDRELPKPGDGDATTVEQVMTFAQEVDASTAFADALELMEEGRRDAVVITTREGGVAGIFTSMDAVRLLREKLRSRQRKPEATHRARHGRDG
jgi:acetoin utilization protein AcuB